MTCSRWVALLGAAVAACACSITAAAPAPTVPAADPGDVVALTARTDAGGAVIAIGEPRMRLALDDSNGQLLMRPARSVVLADQATWITTWDLITGKSVHEIAPVRDAYPDVDVRFAVSHDGEWLASGGSAMKTRLFRWPYNNIEGELPCSAPRAFSADGKLLECDKVTPEIWDVAQRKSLGKAPASAPTGIPQGATFSADGHTLYWTTEHALARWDFGTSGEASVVYQTADEIEYSTFSEHGGRAYLSVYPPNSYVRHGVLVDLATGAASPLGEYGNGALSPSGARVAVTTPMAIRVVDTKTLAVISTIKIAEPVSRLAYGADEHTLAYVEDRALHILDLNAQAPRHFDTPSRFAGWLSDGVAAIEHRGALTQLALATRAWEPITRASVAASLPVRPPAAPVWATRLASGPTSAVVAAEARSDECQPKLRVWTASGGGRTLAMICTGHFEQPDPGWVLGGGRVAAVSTESVTLYDPATGARGAIFPLSARRVPKSEMHAGYESAALSPDGGYLALGWNAPELPDVVPGDEARCVTSRTGNCILDHWIEVWTLAGTPKLMWRVRLETTLDGGVFPATPAGPLVFDNSGQRLLLGTTDGEVHVWSTASGHVEHVEAFHRGSITAITIAPGDHWAYSEDAGGQQRLWLLPPLR